MPGESVQFTQRGFDFPGQDRARQVQNLTLRRKAKHREHVAFLDFVAAKADELVEGGLRVAHSAVGPAGDGVERGLVNVHLFLPRNVSQVLRDERRGNPPKIEALAARQNRRQNLLRLSRREHELHMGWRFLERFEERVERFLCQHVNFVDNVDFEF